MTMKFSLARDSGRISIRVQYVPSVRNASHDGYNAELAIEASVDHGSRGNGPPTTGSQDDLSEGTSTAADRTCEGSVARRGDDPDDLYSCPAGKLLRDVDDVINKIDIIPRNELYAQVLDKLEGIRSAFDSLGFNTGRGVVSKAAILAHERMARCYIILCHCMAMRPGMKASTWLRPAKAALSTLMDIYDLQACRGEVVEGLVNVAEPQMMSLYILSVMKEENGELVKRLQRRWNMRGRVELACCTQVREAMRVYDAVNNNSSTMFFGWLRFVGILEKCLLLPYIEDMRRRALMGLAQGRGRVSTDDLIYKTCLRDEEQLETFLATYGMERDGHMVELRVTQRGSCGWKPTFNWRNREPRSLIPIHLAEPRPWGKLSPFVMGNTTELEDSSFPDPQVSELQPVQVVQDPEPSRRPRATVAVSATIGWWTGSMVVSSLFPSSWLPSHEYTLGGWNRCKSKGKPTQIVRRVSSDPSIIGEPRKNIVPRPPWAQIEVVDNSKSFNIGKILENTLENNQGWSQMQGVLPARQESGVTALFRWNGIMVVPTGTRGRLGNWLEEELMGASEAYRPSCVGIGTHSRALMKTVREMERVKPPLDNLPTSMCSMEVCLERINVRSCRHLDECQSRKLLDIFTQTNAIIFTAFPENYNNFFESPFDGKPDWSRAREILQYMAKQASEAGRCGYNRRVMPILVVVPVRDSALKDKYHGAIVEDALRMRLINKVADGLDLSHAMQGGTSVRVVVLGLHESYGPSCGANTASRERYFEGNVEEANSSHMHHQFVKLAAQNPPRFSTYAGDPNALPNVVPPTPPNRAVEIVSPSQQECPSSEAAEQATTRAHGVGPIETGRDNLVSGSPTREQLPVTGVHRFVFSIVRSAVSIVSGMGWPRS